ncbi:MAG: hypothetical protein A2W25_11265 [candidate division Zixibacteria bacterium RBG_16_53_22]|nr:MAG: hypothetical protein A2W25_11265 [candidate division Zixibacteria bacterium RBG_16_53_22]
MRCLFSYFSAVRCPINNPLSFCKGYNQFISNMAKVIAPALSLRASGNLGDINYTEWRGAAIARIKNPAVQPNTSLQLAQQANVAAAAAAWSTSMSEFERNTWEEIARNCKWSDRMSVRWTPSGYQLFMKFSVQALALGGSIQTIPTLPFPSTLPSRAQVTYNASIPRAEIILDTYPAGQDPDLIQVFRAGPFNGGGRRAIKPEYRQLGSVVTPFQFNDATVTPLKWYWFRVRWGFLIGIVGNWFEMQLECV